MANRPVAHQNHGLFVSGKGAVMAAARLGTLSGFAHPLPAQTASSRDGIGRGATGPRRARWLLTRSVTWLVLLNGGMVLAFI